MRIHLLAVGEKMAPWVDQAYLTYAKRLRGTYALQLQEIAPTKRNTSAGAKQWSEREGQRLLAAVPKRARVIALDSGGRQWSTEQLATQLAGWRDSGHDLALLIGGADGLCQNCLARADTLWSLSALTFPHALVRVIVAEQLYRADSLLRNHPYHRA